MPRYGRHYPRKLKSVGGKVQVDASTGATMLSSFEKPFTMPFCSRIWLTAASYRYKAPVLFSNPQLETDLLVNNWVTCEHVDGVVAVGCQDSEVVLTVGIYGPSCDHVH